MTILSTYPREPIILHGEEHQAWLECHPDGWWMRGGGIEAWGLGPREAEREFEQKVKETK